MDFSRPTQIEYKCGNLKCGKEREDAACQTSVQRLPEVLVLHLPRFQVDEAVPRELRAAAAIKVSLLAVPTLHGV